eukprot:4246359-Lingulodinium_polyedra.AAC.1
MGRPGADGFSPSALGCPQSCPVLRTCDSWESRGVRRLPNGPWLACQVPAAGVQRASCARS